MHPRRDRHTLLSLMALACAAPQAIGQAPEAQPQTIEIVGSHLKRIEIEGPSPVSIYSREQIEASGALRLGDFLLRLPIASAGGFDDRSTTYDNRLGAAGVSLRGLGAGATLVLLNGRRLASYGVALVNDETFVDLNSLPLAAVERVEVLRDGASAIYGADAIGGVVNVVLRRDFTGAATDLRVSGSTQGDSSRRYASLGLGTGDLDEDRYNVFVALDALRQQATRSTDRARSRAAPTSARAADPTGARSSASRRRSACRSKIRWRHRTVRPSSSGGTGGGNVTICSFDIAAYADLLPQVERLSLFSTFTAAPAPGLRLLRRTGGQPLGHPGPAGAAADLHGAARGSFDQPIRAGRGGRLAAHRGGRPAHRRDDRLPPGGDRRRGRAAGWDWSIAGGRQQHRHELHWIDQLRHQRRARRTGSRHAESFRRHQRPGDDRGGEDRCAGPVRERHGFRASEGDDLPRTTRRTGRSRSRSASSTAGSRFSTELDPLTISGDISSSTAPAR